MSVETPVDYLHPVDGPVNSYRAVPESAQPDLTVFIPVFNEASTIGPVLQSVLSVPYRIQVIVIDDGSQDGSQAVVQKFQRDDRVELCVHAENRGKGSAIRTGLARARGRFCIIQDADHEYDPADYPRLIDPLLKGTAVVVYGSRYAGSRQDGWRLLRYGVAILNAAVRMLFAIRLTDEATCYKAMPTELLRALDLQCERFEFCPEVTAKLCREKIPITEVGVSYRPRSVAEGKKLRWTDGWSALQTLWRWRKWTMSPESRQRWQNSLEPTPGVDL